MRGVVIRDFERPAGDTLNELAELGVATVHEAQARTGVPVHRFETPRLAYAAMSAWPICSARTRAGVL